MNDIVHEIRETNRLLREISQDLRALLNKPPIRVGWQGSPDLPATMLDDCIRSDQTTTIIPPKV